MFIKLNLVANDKAVLINVKEIESISPHTISGKTTVETRRISFLVRQTVSEIEDMLMKKVEIIK